MHEDDAHVFAALRAGARGYLVKGADGEEITRAVLAVAGGDAVYGGSVARRIVDFYAGGGDQGPAGAARVPGPDATRAGRPRGSWPSGCRNHEIARRLEMSEKTVRNHVSQILLKLQVPDRTAAALRARDAGLGADSSGHASGRTAPAGRIRRGPRCDVSGVDRGQRFLTVTGARVGVRRGSSRCRGTSPS